MLVYIGADHRGYALKESLKKFLLGAGQDVRDLGNERYDENDDYPDFAGKVAEQVSKNPSGSRGIVICGSGVGADVVANKFKGIRSALAFLPEQASASKKDDDTNVLALAADFTDEKTAEKIVAAWLSAQFLGGERHTRRIRKIEEYENHPVG